MTAVTVVLLTVVTAEAAAPGAPTSVAVYSTEAEEIDDDDETVELGFGELPPGVSEGSPNTATVTIADNDDPAVTVSFDSATYAVTEGWTVDVVVTLNANPERTVTIPVEASLDASGDYSIPGSVTFDAGETQKSVNFVTVDDSTVESAETFTVSFGSTLPTGVSLGSQTTTSVTIADDDAPETGGLELSALAVTGGVGSMYPVFNPRVHHYAIRCPDATTLHVTATARDASHQLTLNNIPVAGMELDKNVVVDSDHDVAIELSDGDESVLYVVHCIPTDFPNVKITKKQAGVSDGLMFLTPARNVFPRDPAFMAIMDNNGVPRFVRHSPGVNPLNFRRHTTDLKIDGRPVHYSVTHRLGSSFNGRHYLLDASFNVIGTVETALPEHSASLHDFLITKDNTFLFFSHGTVTRDVGGNETSTVENVIEEVSPTGDALWSWKSWDHLTIDPDCLGYTFGLGSDPDITAHINALTLIDGDVVASSRGCAQVVRINRSGNSETDDGTDIVWQLGGTDQDADDRAFLAISGDESGRNEFCRQHHATETASGTVVLFDNGVNCLSGEIGELTDPKRGDLPTFSRAVEYAIDPDTGTAEFHREVQLDRRYGHAPFTGSVDILENGHWLINWGYLRDADPSLSVEEYSIAISEVDASGTELLQVKTWEWEGTSRYSTFRAYRESEADVEIPLNLPLPTVTLALTPPSISENNGSSTVTASLDRASSVETTVTVTAEAMSPAVSGDFTLSSNGTLGITAGQTSSTGVVTVGAVDNNVDALDKTVAVTATAENTNGVTQPSPVLLTITDDDSTPVITTTSPILVAENETEVATLQATDADRPAEDLAWAMTGGADRDKFMLTADGELTFAEAKDFENPDDANGDGDYEVRVQVSDGANAVEAALTVRLLDVDDAAPMFLSATVNGATLTLTYDELLDGSSTPAAGDFTVSGGDRARTVTRVAVSGSTVTLTLDVGAGHGEAGIQVSYTVPTGTGARPLQDVLGNEAPRLNNVPVTNETPDTTPPEVSELAITSNPGPDRIYAAEEEIRVTVTFSETVEVTGTPQLQIELGGGKRTATYGGGEETAVLVFAYEVADGESDTDGVGVEADSLLGGTITDEARNNAVLDHDGLAADARHKVDGVKPELAASGAAVVNGTALTLTYDEPLDGSSRPETGDFTVSGGDQARTVIRVAVRGTTVLLTLDTGAEHLEAGIQVSYTPGTNPILDVPGNQAEGLSRESVRNDTPDTTPPEVESLGITSNPGSDQTYAAEDEIEVTVTFNETVEVEGTPQLRLRVGTRTRTAGYLRGTGTEALVFGYEVAEGDEDTAGVSVNAGRISLRGGTIEDEAENAAELAHGALAPQAGHQVDGIRPAFVSAAVDGSSLTLSYGEALDPGSRPAAGDFTVEVGGSGRSVSGVSVSGSEVTLALNPAVQHGDTGIRVSYTVPTGVGANPIRDAVGNQARGLSNRSVTNTTGAPNTAPEITSPSSFDVPENQVVARRLAARDSDPGDEVTGWDIVGGSDQGQFSIASDTGELSFRDPPDYEAPGDNQYAVRVEVRSGAGAREMTAAQTLAVRVTDEREPPGVPEAPTFSGETADSLRVSWTEPENTGPDITDYDVQYQEKGTGRFIDGDQQGPGRTLTLTDLEPGTVYEVQVRATNEEGTGDWSPLGEGMTVTPLTVVMASGTEPPVSGAFTVRFSFSEPVTGFSRSDIETGQDPACVDDQNNTVFCDPGIGTLQTADDRVFTTTVTPWTDRVAHSYTLRLTVGGGAVRSLVGSKPNEEPEEPLEVRVAPPGVEEPISSIGFQASSGSGSVRLSWNRPSDNGGSAIIRYEYRFAPAGEAWSEWGNVGAGTRSVTVGNLVNGREYVFEVRAVSALGKGGVETVTATPEQRVTPPGNGGGGGALLFPPEAPASLAALPGDGAVRLEWSPPESDGGTAVLRYEYRLKEGRGEFGEWTSIPDSAPDEVNASGFTVMELGNGTVHVFELRAVNAAGAGQVSEAVEVVMPLDPAYWSNFRAEDLEGARLMLEAFLSGGSSGDLELRFGEGLRFEEDELDGEGEVTATRMGSYGYRYTSRTTGRLPLDFDGGEVCELRLTFTGEGEGSYVYRCGGALEGQGSFRLSGLNRVPEITSVGPFEVEENQTRAGQVEAVDWDEEDAITGYGITGGADGALFTVAAETGELRFREAPDYENPRDVESEDPQSGAADNEYILVLEVRSGEGERERRREQGIRVRVSDQEEEGAGEEPAPDDPSNFTAGDLEGRRLTLRLTGEEGAVRSLELRFGEGNRFEHIESGGQQTATRSEGASRSGTYSYEKTGPGMGTVSLDYDDGASCEIRLSFTESGLGGFTYDCGEGDPGEGSFRLTTGSLFIPVILSSAGRNQSFFTSELTLTNRGEQEVRLDYTYTAKDEPGRRSGTASDVLPAGRQKIETDALTYLRGLGVPIPETGNQLGTLRVEVPLGSEVEAVVRTTTVVPDGRAGLAYLGVAQEKGFEEAVYLCGLRQNSQDRSNVAIQNMGAPEEGAITLKTTVYSGEAADTSPRVLREVELEPGEFHQYSGLLGTVKNGYVKVERVEGRAPFYAYGVINDQANSDGSFIFPVTASSLAGTAGQTLPVIVETNAFRSELTVTNFSEEARKLDFQFVADGIEAAGNAAGFSMRLEAGQQEIVAEVVDELRRQGVAGLGSTRGFYAGPVFATAEEGDMNGIVIGARTGSKGGGGHYSVFYNAVPFGEAFSREAWVEGLQQNQENRSNLALVNTGEVDGSASVFHLEIYDGETGLLTETVVTKPVPARSWHQINGILGRSSPETLQGYIRIEKVSGENPFLAYGVVNDGGAPGQRSGDGAYLPARE